MKLDKYDLKAWYEYMDTDLPPWQYQQMDYTLKDIEQCLRWRWHHCMDGEEIGQVARKLAVIAGIPIGKKAAHTIRVMAYARTHGGMIISFMYRDKNGYVVRYKAYERSVGPKMSKDYVRLSRCILKMRGEGTASVEPCDVMVGWVTFRTEKGESDGC